jgi:hypothetical protein
METPAYKRTYEVCLMATIHVQKHVFLTHFMLWWINLKAALLTKSLKGTPMSVALSTFQDMQLFV